MSELRIGTKNCLLAEELLTREAILLFFESYKKRHRYWQHHDNKRMLMRLPNIGESRAKEIITYYGLEEKGVASPCK